MATLRRRRVAGDVQAYVEQSHAQRWTPAQIHDGLARWLALQDRTGDLPSLRTVERMAKDLATADESGPWSLADPATTPDEARFAPMVWVAAAVLRGKDKPWLTRREAQIAARIGVALPALHPWDVWRLVLAYLHREPQGLDAADLDHLLGSARLWLARDDGQSGRESARREHFDLHRQRWPDRAYVFLPTWDERVNDREEAVKEVKGLILGTAAGTLVPDEALYRMSRYLAWLARLDVDEAVALLQETADECIQTEQAKRGARRSRRASKRKG